MPKQTNYNCILYDPGDKVQDKHGDGEVMEIEAVRFSTAGEFTIQLLRFKGKNDDIGCFSNLYIPAKETIEKYKDGLKYLDAVRVKVQSPSRTKTVKQPKVEQTETFVATVRYVVHGTFEGRLPIKKENSNN
jgi:hypothetical protein